jgi:hypothetical protein
MHNIAGNEFSLFMLFTSNFVLNKCKSPNAFKVIKNPWIIFLQTFSKVQFNFFAPGLIYGTLSLGFFTQNTELAPA